MFDFCFEQLHHFDARTGGAADTDGGMFIRFKYFFHMTVGNLVPFGRPAVSGNDDALGEF
jgi:hypothetical protein